MELKTLMQNLTRNTQMQKSNNLQGVNVEKREAINMALELFSDGEVVKGEVIDVNNLTAKILTQNGDEINGQLQTRGQLSIGEERQFLVKQDESGRTSFSIIPEDEEVLVNNNIAKALKDFGLNSDDKNLTLAKKLINSNLPVNKETIQTLNRGLALLSGDSEGLEKTLFMLKNEMPVNIKNTNLLNQFISKEMKALDNLNNIETAVKNLDDGQLKDNIIKILNNGNGDGLAKGGEPVAEKVPLQNNNENTITKTEDNIKQEANVEGKGKDSEVIKESQVMAVEGEEIEKNDNKLLYRDKSELSQDNLKENVVNDKYKLNLKFSPKNLDIKDLEEFLNNTKNKLEEALKTLENSKVPGAKELGEQLTVAKESMEFTSQLKENVFLQIPLSINSHETNGELLVFNNKAGGKNKNKKATSVIVGLDTENLGRFETYIKKEDKKIDLQFRLEDDRVINLVKSNMSSLEELLSAKNLKIESIQFKKIENPFTIISKDENEDDVVDLKVNSMKFNIKM